MVAHGTAEYHHYLHLSFQCTEQIRDKFNLTPALVSYWEYRESLFRIALVTEDEDAVEEVKTTFDDEFMHHYSGETYAKVSRRIPYHE